MKPTIVVVNRYQDIFERFIGSIRKFEPDLPVILVADGHGRQYDGVRTVRVDRDDFNFSAYASVGIGECDGDVLLCNDDIVLTEPGCLSRLHERAVSLDGIGIASPLIKGTVGCNYQSWYQRDRFFPLGSHDLKPVDRVCFVCVWLSRKMISRIGMLNPYVEENTGYGLEDIEYCQRALAFGWSVVVYSGSHVIHGNGQYREERGQSWSLSYGRRYGVYAALHPSHGRRGGAARLT